MPRLQYLRKRQMRAVAQLLADAFHDDPWFGWMFPDSVTRPVLGTMWMRATAEASFDAGHAFVTVADDSDREVVTGASLWAPPDVELFAGGRFVPLWHLIAGANPTRLDEMREGLSLFATLHPHDEPHFYLNTIGVDPARCGMGDGRVLVEPMLDLADRDRVPCYLESSNPRNVSFYERFGFRVLDEVRMPNGGPSIRPMWRDAH
ncbi:MAG: GNAT family N-acetyltransferase [Actinomycetota bacterium]|nr:GNAT family N-acetyltransferase [Actinomycetota bacterium]